MDGGRSGSSKVKHERTCAGCGSQSPKRAMMRVVRTPDGEVRYDPTGRANGRGAYLCRNVDCVRAAKKKRALARALKTDVDESVYAMLESLCAEGKNDG